MLLGHPKKENVSRQRKKMEGTNGPDPLVMVEADSHLKLLPTSILDIYKVFQHIDMLSIGIW
jgi:hypothetical protein